MPGTRIANKWLALALFALVSVGVSAWGYQAYATANAAGARMESAILALITKREAVASYYIDRAKEKVNIAPAIQSDWEKVAREVIKGRFGDTGTQTALLFLKEQGYPVPPDAFHDLQQVLEAGRQEFAQTEAELGLQKQAYRTALSQPGQGRWLRWAGYPKNYVE